MKDREVLPRFEEKPLYRAQEVVPPYWRKYYIMQAGNWTVTDSYDLEGKFCVFRYWSYADFWENFLTSHQLLTEKLLDLTSWQWYNAFVKVRGDSIPGLFLFMELWWDCWIGGSFLPNIAFWKKFLNLEKNGPSQANVLWRGTWWKEWSRSYISRWQYPVRGFSMSSVTH